MIGSAIRKARKALDISQETLAADVGLSVSQISRYENGEREPYVCDLIKIAARLNVPPMALVDLDEAKRWESEVANKPMGNEAELLKAALSAVVEAWGVSEARAARFSEDLLSVLRMPLDPKLQLSAHDQTKMRAATVAQLLASELRFQ